MDLKDKNIPGCDGSEPAGLSVIEELLQREKIPIQCILDKIPIGIIILNNKKRSVILVNKHYHSLVPHYKENEILTNIYKHIDANIASQKENNLIQDLTITVKDKEFLINYTICQVSDENVIVLLEEVTSGVTHFLSKQENQYYKGLYELIAEIVHEVGNPLAGINTGLQVLLLNFSNWSEDKIKDYLERTIQEISRLTECLRRMREFSNENESLDINPTNLKQLIDRGMLQYEGLLREKGIACKRSIPEDTQVLVDKGAFHKILANLFSNTLSVLIPGNNVEFYVQDIDEYYVKLIYQTDGVLIPEGSLEKIFSPVFFSRDPSKGTGLGISLRLMTRMGGTMKVVKPEAGTGTKFILYIPNHTQKTSWTASHE
ncbi:MAG: hypothetical protein QG657_3661 [Acidobacteriota bacterium]|nr:hypothetical protein [Acidobacteriota bacterium]